ncbi:MAG: fatty acid desaturase [Bacteroidia bacterium]
MSTSTITSSRSNTGVLLGCVVILLWTIVLGLNFWFPVVWESPLTWLRLWLQVHLFTGLFITAHDAMHGTVAPGRTKLNHRIGSIAAFLFIFNQYKKLLPKHHEHHRYVATKDDPDFHNGHPAFLRWFFDFVKEYLTIWQVLAAAVFFNLLMWLGIPEANLILYWVVASVLSMLQLFYFGTYLPHRGEHDNKHHARSQKPNHVWAFLSCYFFGYHYEHHDRPGVPWWRLWKEVK